MTDIKSEDRTDDELVHELFKVFPRVFSKKEPRDEYFANLLATADSVTVSDVLKAPCVQKVTSNPDIIKRAIGLYRGFTVTDEVIKLYTYRREPQHTLIVKELPAGLTPEQVINLFHSDTQQGPSPLSARADQHNTWYINYGTEDDVKHALSIGKSISYDGKALRVSIKRDLQQRQSYDARGGRNEYANAEMQMGMSSHMMNPFPVYYQQPMMPNQGYYSYVNTMAYPTMGSPMMYSYDVPVGYYQQNYYMQYANMPGAPQPVAQHQQQPNVTQPNANQPQQNQYAANYGRRPVRGGNYGQPNAVYGQGGRINGGNSYNNAVRKDKPVRPEEAGVAEVTSSPQEVAVPVVQVNESTPTEETHNTDSDEVIVSGGSSDSAVEGEAVGTPGAEVALTDKADKRKTAKEYKPRTNTDKKPGNRSPGTTNSRPNGGSAHMKPKDKSTGAPKSNEPKSKPPIVKLTMDSDFPVFIDQKTTASSTPAAGSGWANAVKKAPIVTPASESTQTKAVLSVTSPAVSEPLSKAPAVESVAKPVVSAPPAAPAVERVVPVEVKAPVIAEPTVAPVVANAVPAKKSFADALKSSN